MARRESEDLVRRGIGAVRVGMQVSAQSSEDGIRNPMKRTVQVVLVGLMTHRCQAWMRRDAVVVLVVVAVLDWKRAGDVSSPWCGLH